MLQRELRAAPVHRRCRLKRAGFVAVTGVTLIWGLVHFGQPLSHQTGEGVLQTLVLLLIVLACFVTPAAASGFFPGEKSRHTLGVLLLTPQSSLALVLSRVCCTSVAFALGIVVALPCCAFCLPLMDTHWLNLVAAGAVVLTTGWLGACLGVFISILLMDRMMAFFLALISGVCLFVVFPRVVAVSATTTAAPYVIDVVLPAVSPYYAGRQLFSAPATAGSFAFVVFALVVSAPLIAIAASLLPKRAYALRQNVDPRYLERDRKSVV